MVHRPTDGRSPGRREFLQSIAATAAAIPMERAVAAAAAKAPPPNPESLTCDYDEADLRLAAMCLIGLTATLQVARHVEIAHADCEGCMLCQDVEGIAFTIEKYQSLLSSGIQPWTTTFVQKMFNAGRQPDGSIVYETESDITAERATALAIAAARAAS
jgi:hypothetical protein